MIDHISLGVSSLDDAHQFYTRLFAPLGYSCQRRTEAEIAFGTEKNWAFWLYPTAPEDQRTGARAHTAIRADSEGAVRHAFDEAIASGGTPVRAPGDRPDISPLYFGAILRDADGHTIELTHWRTE
jgi:catechol 2,3-dioxygenase-like lactoylglutathione lyase family enzyme